MSVLAWCTETWRKRHADRAWMFHGALVAVALVVFTPLLSHHGGWASSTALGAPQTLTCRSMFWQPSYDCGVNGINCAPSPTDWFPLRCPSRCSWPDASLSAWGGAGGTAYRGDSRICVAAAHAGLVSSTRGGCAMARLRGPASNFVGSATNGVRTLSSSWFAQSIEFAALDGSACTELGWVILALMCVWLAVLALILRPCAFFVWSMASGFWYALLVARQVDDLKAAFADGTANFCLLAAGSAFMYAMSVRATLWCAPDNDEGSGVDEDSDCSDAGEATGAHHSPASIAPTAVELHESALSVPLSPSSTLRNDARSADDLPEHVHADASLSYGVRLRAALDSNAGAANATLFLPPFVLLLHQNLFIYFLPDIDLSPALFSLAASSAAALATVIVMVVALVAFAIYFLRVLCKRPRHVWHAYAASYGVLVLVFVLVLVGVLTPDYSLHIHHAFLPLVLAPLTRARRDPIALIALGALCGMHVNGLAFWGWSANFAVSVSGGSGGDAPLDAPTLVRNLTVSLASQALERLPSTSPLSALATFPIVSLASPAALWGAGLSSTSTLQAMYGAPAIDRVHQIVAFQSVVAAAHEADAFDDRASSRAFDHVRAAVPSTATSVVAHTAAAADSIVATAQFTVPPFTVLFANSVEMYRTWSAAQNITVSKLVLNTTYAFYFRPFASWGALGAKSRTLLLSTSGVPVCGNATSNQSVC